jgi:Peptidase A4 family
LGRDSDSDSRSLVRGSRAEGQGRDSSHFLLAWTRDRPAYSGACTTGPITENLRSRTFSDNFSPTQIIPANPGECIGGSRPSAEPPDRILQFSVVWLIVGPLGAPGARAFRRFEAGAPPDFRSELRYRGRPPKLGNLIRLDSVSQNERTCPVITLEGNSTLAQRGLFGFPLIQLENLPGAMARAPIKGRLWAFFGVAIASVLLAGGAFTVSSFAAAAVSPTSGQPAPVQLSGASYGLRNENSTSWAGVVVDARANTVTKVFAAWTVGRGFAGNCNGSNSDAEASVWVGMGGWNSSTIVRAGETITCNHRSFTYSGWYQFYPSPPVIVSTNLSGGGDQVYLDYLTSNHTYLIEVDGFSGWVNDLSVNRSSADFIIEVPSNSTQTFPLADFRNVTFSRMEATIGDRTWHPVTYASVRHPLSVFLLTMVSSKGSAVMAVIAPQTSGGAGRVTVAWKGYGP